MLVEITLRTHMNEIPKTCSDCIFVESCDQLVDKLLKRGNTQFTVKAVRGRSKNCPLKVIEE